MAQKHTKPGTIGGRTFGNAGAIGHLLLLLRVVLPFLILLILSRHRDTVVNILNTAIGMEYIFTVVHVYSTLTVRILIASAFVPTMALIWLIASRNTQGTRLLIYAGTSALLFALVMWYFRSPKAGAAIGVFSFILILGNGLSRLGESKTVNAGLWGLIGIEFLFPRLYFLWLKAKVMSVSNAGPKEPSVWRIVPGTALAVLAITMLLPYPMLMHMGSKLFMSQQATVIFGPQYFIWSRYDVSAIARNPQNGDLYLCGDTQISPKILNGATGAPVELGVSSDGNEFCAFSDPANQFLTADQATGDFLMVDPQSSLPASRLSLPDLPDGEILIAAHPVLPLAVAASENESATGQGADIRVIDLSLRKVIQEIDDDAGFLILHPTRPILYINHFAHDLGVRAYDMETGAKLASSVKFGRSDRMTFDKNRDEVLATAPEFGQIWRFDATTLEAKTPINTVFGVRGLAVDHERDLLLTSSFLTNKVDVIDLKTSRSLRRYRLGPWMRDIHVVSEEGIAYVASRYGLYRLNYLE